MVFAAQRTASYNLIFRCVTACQFVGLLYYSVMGSCLLGRYDIATWC